MLELVYQTQQAFGLDILDPLSYTCSFILQPAPFKSIFISQLRFVNILLKTIGVMSLNGDVTL